MLTSQTTSIPTETYGRQWNAIEKMWRQDPCGSAYGGELMGRSPGSGNLRDRLVRTRVFDTGSALERPETIWVISTHIVRLRLQCYGPRRARMQWSLWTARILGSGAHDATRDAG